MSINTAKEYFQNFDIDTTHTYTDSHGKKNVKDNKDYGFNNKFKEDYYKNDYSQNDYSKKDYFKEDYSKEDYSKKDYSKEDYFKRSIDEINRKLILSNRKIEHKIHEKTNKIIVKIIDLSSGEVIREIPSEKSLDSYVKLIEMIGLIFDIES